MMATEAMAETCSWYWYVICTW